MTARTSNRRAIELSRCPDHPEHTKHDYMLGYKVCKADGCWWNDRHLNTDHVTLI